jgi:CheY-like chemotaxis protein
MKILLADDEPFVREIVVKLLLRAGHTVQTAIDGQCALDAFQGGTFDIVMTDLGMPGLDGLALAKLIKIRAPAQIVVLLTGAGDDGAVPANVDFVLSKPIGLEALTNALGRLAA